MNKKPRLCFVGNMLGRNAGYVTTQGQITADLFAAEGYEVTCVSSKISRIKRLAEIAAVLIKNNHRFDLILLEVYSGLSFVIADLVSLLCKTFHLPLIMVLHGGNLPEFIEKHPRWTKRILRRADCLVAPSPFLAEKIGNFGFDIKIVSNVIKLNSSLFRERSQISPRLLWMRSFHHIYNPQMAIEVLAELRKSEQTASLVMAGKDKGLEDEIKKRVEEMNLSGAVRFAGFLDEQQKQKEFAETDIYLNTNRIDNMPVSIIEACAMGVPVVATNVGGLPYLITDGENGILCENENVAEMVAGIKKLIDNPALTRRISQNGRQLAERSAWATVKNDWERLFNEILDVKSSADSDKVSNSNLKVKRASLQ